jgi:hypothetical protein
MILFMGAGTCARPKPMGRGLKYGIPGVDWRRSTSEIAAETPPLLKVFSERYCPSLSKSIVTV